MTHGAGWETNVFSLPFHPSFAYCLRNAIASQRRRNELVVRAHLRFSAGAYRKWNMKMLRGGYHGGKRNRFLNAWRRAKYARYFDRRDNIYYFGARATAEVSFKFIWKPRYPPSHEIISSLCLASFVPLPPPAVLLNKRRGRSLAAGKRATPANIKPRDYELQFSNVQRRHISLSLSLSVLLLLKIRNFHCCRVILIWRGFFESVFLLSLYRLLYGYC